MILLTLLIIPSLIALGSFLLGGHRVTWQEFVGQLLAQLALIGTAMMVMYSMDTHDTEVWGGRVASKEREVVSCSHAYPCHCRPVSCGKNCTTVHCDICFQHRFDVDWTVKTTNGEGLEIDRVNSQGTIEPPRWTAVKIGEPTAVAHSYENFVKAAPDSLFRHQGLLEKYQDKLPLYPGKIYDYYRIDRLVQVDVQVPDPDAWNRPLEDLNASLGAEKQVNLAVVLVGNQPDDYYEALEQSWIGAKKNDVVAVIGTDGKAIKWARIMAWTDSEMFRVQARDRLLDLKTLDPKLVLGAMSDTIKTLYVRKPMSDFAYLQESITPTPGQYVFLLIFGILTSIGISVFVVKNDIEEGGSATSRWDMSGRRNHHWR